MRRINKSGKSKAAFVLSPAMIVATSLATNISLVSPLVSAQSDEASRGVGLEEVIVSARRQKESVQDSPLSVSAFNAESMKSLGLTNLKEFDGIVPGLNMGGGGNGVKGDSNPFIRGVGQRETKVTIDSAVGTYVDGVYVGRAAGALLDAVDVESIEVLRGPQGTLFGKNTTGGAIVITTTKPGPEQGGHVDITMGNLGRKNASAAVNVPIIDDTLYSRFTVASTKNDGYTENLIDGRNWSDDDRLMGIFQLRWTPNDDLVADFMLSATKTRQQPRGQKCRSFSEEFLALGGGKPQLEGLIDQNLGNDAYQAECTKLDATDQFESEQADNTIFGNSVYEVDTTMSAITLDWHLTESLDFKSITAWRRTEQQADEDLDGNGFGVTGRRQLSGNQTDQYSQEFQFQGLAFDDRLRYVLGVYGFWEQTDNDALNDYAGYVTITDSSDPNVTQQNILLAQSLYTVRETDNEAYSVFSQLYFDLTENIELTLGLRYTDETRETTYLEGNIHPQSLYSVTNPISESCNNNSLLTGNCSIQYGPNSEFVFNPFEQWQYGFDVNGNGDIDANEVGIYGSDSGERSDEAWTPMASIKYLATDEVLDALNLDSGMVFFTYSEGFRSGGVTVANGDFTGNGIKDLENFEPEEVINYEVGLKLDLLEKSLRTNFAMFYTEYTNIQVTTVVQEKSSGLGLPLPAIENAGRAEISGLEGEVTFLPSENLRFMLNFAYTDGQYKEYTVDSSVLGEEVVGLDRSDEPMPRLADWTAFFAMDYFIFTEEWGTIIPSINVRYSTEIYHGFDRDSYLVAKAGGELWSPEIHFLGARVTWQLPDDRTTVTLWGKNLNNEDDYLVGGVPLVGVARSSGVIYAEPRTFGLDVSYRFGDE